MKQLVGKANSYSLISQKGEPEIKKTGKFGNTILAQSTDGKKVIVKQINRQVVNADIALAAMLREIKYTPKGNLFLSPIDFFEINQSVFLVRPFVEGKSLKEVLDEKILYKKLSRFQKIKIALLVLHALKELEEYQIVHRDIRPSNLLITNWNEVKQNSSITPEIKLIDFGLAQKKGEIFPENYRLPFAMIYAPPEQLLNKHHLVSSWSDIYAWGITFYEFFTTEKPWYSDNPEFLMNLQLNLPLPENEAIDKSLLNILNKASAKQKLPKPPAVLGCKTLEEYIIKGIEARFGNALTVIEELNKHIPINLK